MQTMPLKQKKANISNPCSLVLFSMFESLISHYDILLPAIQRTGYRITIPSFLADHMAFTTLNGVSLFVDGVSLFTSRSVNSMQAAG